METIRPVIIAGGSGSRLWPLSRQLNPKQFLPLTDGKLTMLQQTAHRLQGMSVESPMVICNEQHRFMAAEQLRVAGYEDARILLEPAGRNTAPAIALAALQRLAEGEDSVLLVLAADHLIRDDSAFRDSVRRASALAEAGNLVTFGVVPSHPETGYGYILKGHALGDNGNRVQAFVEKPDSETAQAYMDSGEYLWNSGMFMFRASRFVEELKQYRPDILDVCRSALAESVSDSVFTRVPVEIFGACPDESVDYAVMEKTASAAVVPLDAGWSDIGSWSALWEVSDRDSLGNAVSGDVINERSTGCLVRAEHRLVATLDVEDLVVVETKDAVLVAHRDHVQEVKRVVERIKDDGRHEHLNHREVYRPWGVYDSIDSGHRYQVKRITVKPGAKLSVQMHHHRAEHWVVVSGTAKVTNDNETYLVSENQSTYIPVGRVHSLENPGVIDLELIEVQSGSYLGEDDIVRFEDQYGRT